MEIFRRKSPILVVLRGFLGRINRKQNTENRRQHNNGGITGQSDISNLRFQISLKCRMSDLQLNRISIRCEITSDFGNKKMQNKANVNIDNMA
jgi:hypothetical protein